MNTQPLPQTQKQRPLLSGHAFSPTSETQASTTGITPSAVLPEQFYDTPQGAARMHWPVALMRAVLNDAIECYQKQFVANGRRIERLAKEAEVWLSDDNERWPFAFVNVCAALGIEPAYLRRGLRRARHHSPKTVKHTVRHAESVRRFRRIAA